MIIVLSTRCIKFVASAKKLTVEMMASLSAFSGSLLGSVIGVSVLWLVWRTQPRSDFKNNQHSRQILDAQFNISAILPDGSQIHVAVEPGTTVDDLQKGILIPKRLIGHEFIEIYRAPEASEFNKSIADDIIHEIDSKWYDHGPLIEIYALILMKMLDDPGFYKVRLFKQNGRLKADLCTFSYSDRIDLGRDQIDRFADLLKRLTESTQEFQSG